MRLIAGNNAGVHAFNPHEPLATATRAQLLFAERIVYGPAKESGRQVLEALDRLQADLGFPNMVSEHFDALRSILRTLAISPDTVGLNSHQNTSQPPPQLQPAELSANEPYQVFSPPQPTMSRPGTTNTPK